MSATHHAEQKVSPKQLILVIKKLLLLAMDHADFTWMIAESCVIQNRPCEYGKHTELEMAFEP